MASFVFVKLFDFQSSAAAVLKLYACPGGYAKIILVMAENAKKKEVKIKTEK